MILNLAERSTWFDITFKDCGDDYTLHIYSAARLAIHVQTFDLRQEDEFYTCRRVLGVFRLCEYVGGQYGKYFRQ